MKVALISRTFTAAGRRSKAEGGASVVRLGRMVSTTLCTAVDISETCAFEGTHRRSTGRERRRQDKRAEKEGKRRE